MKRIMIIDYSNTIFYTVRIIFFSKVNYVFHSDWQKNVIERVIIIIYEEKELLDVPKIVQDNRWTIPIMFT